MVALTRVAQWKDRKKSLTGVAFNWHEVAGAGPSLNLTRFPQEKTQTNVKSESFVFNKSRWKGISEATGYK